jgi:hypothetical protein
MNAWDDEFIDEEEEGYFEFNQNRIGQFHFGYVDGQMDCRQTTRDGGPVMEWTWDGNDEMDMTHGQGWVTVQDDELHGMIFFHEGDDSDFVAKKKRRRERLTQSRRNRKSSS